MANNGFGGGSTFGFIPSGPSDIGRKTRQNQANMASQNGQVPGGFSPNTGSGQPGGGFQPTPPPAAPEMNFSDPSTWGPSGDTMPGGGAPDPITGQYDSTMSGGGQSYYGSSTYAPTYGGSPGAPSGQSGMYDYMTPGFNPGGSQIGGGEGIFGGGGGGLGNYTGSGNDPSQPPPPGMGGNSFFNPITGQNSDPNSPMNQMNYQSPNTTFSGEPGYFDRLRESNERNALLRRQSQDELLEYRRSQGLAGGSGGRQTISPTDYSINRPTRGPFDMLQPQGAAAINPDGTVNQQSNDDPLSQGRPNEETGYVQNGTSGGGNFNRGPGNMGGVVDPSRYGGYILPGTGHPGEGGNSTGGDIGRPPSGAYAPGYEGNMQSDTPGRDPLGNQIPYGEGIFSGPPPSVDGGGMGYPQIPDWLRPDTVAPGDNPELQKPQPQPQSESDSGGSWPMVGSGQTPAGGPSKADRQARAQQQHQQLMQLLMGNKISSGDALGMMRNRGVSPAQFGNYYNHQYNL